MQQTDPDTDLSRRRIIALAKTVKERNTAYYTTTPLSFLAVQIREFIRICEENHILEPAHLERIISAVFFPSPSALNKKDREYLAFLISGTEAGADARTHSIEKFCASIRKYQT